MFLYEFLSWTMGHFWTLDALHRGRRCPESGFEEVASARISVFIGKTDALRGKFKVFLQKIWHLNEAGQSVEDKKQTVRVLDDTFQGMGLKNKTI